jgi:hypothetical protein
LIFGIDVPDAHSIVVAGSEEAVVFGVDDEVGDGIGVAFEHLDDLVFVDGPIEDEVVFFGSHQNGTVVVGVGQLLDLVRFHEEFAVALGIGGQKHIQGLRIRDVEHLPVVGKVKSDNVLAMLLDYFGWLKALKQLRSQLQTRHYYYTS